MILKNPNIFLKNYPIFIKSYLIPHYIDKKNSIHNVIGINKSGIMIKTLPLLKLFSFIISFICKKAAPIKNIVMGINVESQKPSLNQ